MTTPVSGRLSAEQWYAPPNSESAIKVARCVEQGGVALFPADTVYGFFGSALDPKSFERVYEIKRRERRKPFVVYILPENVERVAYLNPLARRLIECFWPNDALALVLPKRKSVSDRFTAGKDTIAVMTASGAFVSEVLANCDTVMFGTTCNVSGEPEITKIRDAEEFDVLVDVAVGGDDLLKHSVPSTIVDCTGPVPKILRESAVPAEKVFAAVSAARQTR